MAKSEKPPTLKLTRATPALDGVTLTNNIARVVLAIQKSKVLTKDLKDELRQLIKIYVEHGGGQ